MRDCYKGRRHGRMWEYVWVGGRTPGTGHTESENYYGINFVKDKSSSMHYKLETAKVKLSCLTLTGLFLGFL